jgi:hypothetical protein
MDEHCNSGKLGRSRSSRRTASFYAFMFCHPERAFCAKDLCSCCGREDCTHFLAEEEPVTGGSHSRPEARYYAGEFAAGGGFGGAAGGD